MLDFLNSIFTHLTILAYNIPDLKPIGQVIIDAANKILATIFVILGVGVGWWSIISLIKIAKDRNDSEARANHIQGLQWMFGAFISAPILISIVNILIKQLAIPAIGG